MRQLTTFLKTTPANVGAQGALAAGGHAQAVRFAGGSLAGVAQAHSDSAAAGVWHQAAGGVSAGE